MTSSVVTETHPHQRRPAALSDATAQALAADLKRQLQGEVRFDSGSRALYATDASNYRQVPIGVVVPKSIDDVMATVALCRQYGAPVLSRGGGTSLAGQCCNVAVVMDFTKYLNRLLELDPQRQQARIQPGIVLDSLRSAAEQHHLTFGPDPATHTHCALGGMMGNNSCGIHSVMAGKTVDNVHELEVLLYDGTRMRVGKTPEEELQAIIDRGGRQGEIYGRLRALRDRYADEIRARYPKIPRRVSGYNLDELLPENGFHVARALVGSEGTLVTYLEAVLRLVPSPQFRTLVVLGYPDVYQAGDHVPEVMQLQPIGLEGLDDLLIRHMLKKGLHPRDAKLLPAGNGWLLVEFGGDTPDEANEHAQRLIDWAGKQPHAPSVQFYERPEQQARLWAVREAGLGSTAFVPGERDTWPGWEDSAVDPQDIGPYMRQLRQLFDKYGYACSLYGHFGQGCVHTRIDFGLYTEAGVAKFRRFIGEAADLVVSYGGSLSAEHGDGQARAEFLPKMFGDDLIEAFREFKAIWDPLGKMNPGKIVDPYRVDENLRLGPDYHPPHVATHFQFPSDEGHFARATLRCVGVGECRRHEGGTMCPSYMVTREEQHSTRGRARLLFEMLEGQVIHDGWQSEEVKDALDLCLACKGCKGDCPVNVDLATYKAEFLAHYYEKKHRPRAAYSMGWIHRWARIAAKAPGLANLIGRAPALGSLVKWIAGVAPQRQLPAFASQTFKQWFRERGVKNAGRPPVILWPDTFTNYFHPQIGKAAVEVLEAAGRQVLVPGRDLCCGRPLYDWGMLDQAKTQLREIIDVLRPALREGIPVVGLEPSCTAVFRDELTNLFPKDPDARRLHDQTLLFSEFLNQHLPEFEWPQLQRKALVHGHCHHKAVIGFGDEVEVLKKMGLDYELLDSGCCGMAGSFGFERGERYRVAVACGERVLLPAVRGAADDTLVMTDGFSCHEQIRQETGRQALHLAEVVASALRAEGRIGRVPAARVTAPRPPRHEATGWLIAAAVGVGVFAAATYLSRAGRCDPSEVRE
jgi:FAD/FMN-containing dehydrogenase/Fe-S oxidoreductase